MSGRLRSDFVAMRIGSPWARPTRVAALASNASRSTTASGPGRSRVAADSRAATGAGGRRGMRGTLSHFRGRPPSPSKEQSAAGALPQSKSNPPAALPSSGKSNPSRRMLSRSSGTHAETRGLLFRLSAARRIALSMQPTRSTTERARACRALFASLGGSGSSRARAARATAYVSARACSSAGCTRSSASASATPASSSDRSAWSSSSRRASAGSVDSLARRIASVSTPSRRSVPGVLPVSTSRRRCR